MPWFLGSSHMVFGDWRGYFLPVLLWSTVWKGLALWHAAQRKEVGWFVVLLFVQTIGILDLFYLFFIVHAFSKPAKKR